METFTFKKYPKQNGLAKVDDYGGGFIKYGGKRCGFYKGKVENKFDVWFHVVDSKEECGWKNIRIQKVFNSEKEMKDYLKEHTSDIVNSIKFHFLED